MEYFSIVASTAAAAMNVMVVILRCAIINMRAQRIVVILESNYATTTYQHRYVRRIRNPNKRFHASTMYQIVTLSYDVAGHYSMCHLSGLQ